MAGALGALGCSNVPTVFGTPQGLEGSGGTTPQPGLGGDGTDPFVDSPADDGGLPPGPRPGVCGNGKLEELELCDDGNTDGADGCSADCSSVNPDYLCLEPGEPCERLETCGNGVVEGTELCDDGNTTDDDGCRARCHAIEDGYACIKPGEACVVLPVCGNGERERGEQCDDGEAEPSDGDGCSAECEVEEGYFCVPGRACVPQSCGDGQRTPDEACDDGNDSDGDGCSSGCAIEEGWRCSQSGCRPICGDLALAGNEECDDGNVESGDGCSSACKEEPFHTCPGEPGSCVSDIVCGDGDLDPGEVCDPAIEGSEACYDDSENEALACRGFASPLVDPAVCGNGVIELDEACDGDSTGNDGCVDCAVQDGFACPKANYCFRIPACGDGLLQPGEQCDPGAVSTVGCNECRRDASYFCSGQPSVCVLSVCGDGVRAPDEQCDDGPGSVGAPGVAVDGDGCSTDCEVESGWVCPPAMRCLPVCGDGVLQGSEQCEEAGPACSHCRLEPGYDCDSSGKNCHATVCGNGNPADPIGSAEAGEGCDDGNRIAGDGCGPTCQLEPIVDVGPSPTVAVTCGDGLATGSEECDDGNRTDGDGCSSACTEEPGWTCDPIIEYPDSIQFKITYRDFRQRNEVGGHPHMRIQGQSPPDLGVDLGIVGAACTYANRASCARLDAQGKPTYVGGSGGTHPTIDPTGDNLSATYHQSAFRLWYRDSNAGSVMDPAGSAAIVMAANPTPLPAAGVDTLLLTRVGSTTAYEFAAGNTFYPLGSSSGPTTPLRGFGNTPNTSGVPTRNWQFTSELRYFFQYQGGETLTFFGDDDVWVFINGRLAVDIGGIHTQRWGRVVLGDDGRVGTSSSGTDSNCSQHATTTLANLNGCLTAAEESDPLDERFGLTRGQVYEIVVFQAERNPTESNYRLTLDGFIAPRSSCRTTCGDGIVAGSEACDAGDENQPSGYGVCLTGSCTFSFCGDGVRSDPPEQCDNRTNANVYDDGTAPNPCAPGCQVPGRCGDGVVQSGFEVCDDGVNDGSHGGCMPGCQSLAGYCGDGTVQSPHEQCDTPGAFTLYGGCGYDCRWAPRCGDGVRNGPEICDEGAANGTTSSGCTALCELSPYCGDGVKSAGEACDYGPFAYVGDPADAPYGGCTTACKWGPRCGDGHEDASFGEECDDGRANSNDEYDGCTKACLLGPRCGDAVRQAAFGEECDNGFNDDTYARAGADQPCGAGCRSVPYCGDGEVQAAEELCDDGGDNSDGAYGGCTTQCEWGPYCGDGVKNGPEQCDDGRNNVAYSPDGKGCSHRCKKDVPYCGDGERNGPEQCDLGTAANTGTYGSCNADCTRAPRCGDGKLQRAAGEECDDGPSGSLSCTPTCRRRNVLR